MPRGIPIDLTSAKYEPVRRGYIFTGWYEDKALTKKLTSIELMGSRTGLCRLAAGHHAL